MTPSFPQNDIAVLELESELTFGPDVAAICSPDPNNDYAGEVAIVAGWGDLESGGSKLLLLVLNTVIWYRKVKDHL